MKNTLTNKNINLKICLNHNYSKTAVLTLFALRVDCVVELKFALHLKRVFPMGLKLLQRSSILKLSLIVGDTHSSSPPKLSTDCHETLLRDSEGTGLTQLIYHHPGHKFPNFFLPLRGDGSKC